MSNPENEELQEENYSLKNEKGFSEIVRSYQERLYWHIRKMVLSHEDANDILQNTFIKAWNGLSGFRGDSQISTWLYRIATNETLSFLSKKRTQNIQSFNELEDLLLTNLKSDNYFNGNDAQLKLQEAILKLPEKQRLVFNMKYFDDITYEEMSKVLSTSVGALKASYHHAVKKIEKYLEE